MKDLYNIYLSMICDQYDGEFPQKYSKDILSLALNHYTTPLIYKYYMNEQQYLSQIRRQMKTIIGNYYMFSEFTDMVTSLFTRNHIRYFLMKGIHLSECYPVCDIRKQSDVDIYIPDTSEFKMARRLLLANGFTAKKDTSTHHLEFIYRSPVGGSQLILELHYDVVSKYQYAPANKVLDEVFNKDSLMNYYMTTGGRKYNVLPPTQNAFYMLHHMLNHYMFSGFGIRLLYDYRMFLIRYNDEIDYELLKKWCDDSGILNFYGIIIGTLKQYMYLSNDIDADTVYEEDICEYFIENVLTGGDFGADSAGMLINSTSYKNITFFTYLKEGHYQMKATFRRLHKIILLWPILWAITFVTFIINNKRVRKASISEIIKNFKDTNKKIRMIKIFEDR